MYIYDFNYNGKIQTWIVPFDGLYKIEAFGAQGGSVMYAVNSYTNRHEGGKGAYVSGEFDLKAGEVLYILVGGAGQSKDWSDWGGGGGGGTFVAKSTTVKTYKLLAGFNQYVSPLIVAGGGGGAGDNGCGAIGNGQTQAGYGGVGRAATATEGCGITNSSVGGAGFASNSSGGATPPYSFLNGGAAGTWSYNGGFGGGGAPYDGGGGGGGWRGGDSPGNNTGMGGYSYNIGTNQIGADGVQVGNGSVIITLKNNTKTILSFYYTGAVQKWVVPFTGTYKFECWGGQGGDMKNGYTGKGGRGGYACGEKLLNAGQTIYIYVGGQGVGYNSSTNHTGGWNGGGTCYQGASGGGGASDIRTILGDLNSRFIVAGGGGGSNDSTDGGDGGGLIGGNGQTVGGTSGTGGTQTSGGTGWIAGTFGIGAGVANANGDGGAGGGGWYGGGKGQGYNSAGGGGSSYIDGLLNASTISGVNSGDGKIIITYSKPACVLEKDSKYYFPNADYFDSVTNTFKDITIDEIVSKINSSYNDFNILKINNPFTVGTTTYRPSDLIDFTQYKLVLLMPTDIISPLKSTTITYIQSSTALSKTIIKIKDSCNPLNEDLNNAYFDITAVSKNNISYTFNYYSNESVTNICDVIDTEIFKDSFYSTFKLNSPSSILKSVGIYTVDKVNYTKIKEDHLNIERNFENTWITFRNSYSKVLINQINKVHFKYIKETVDTF